MNVYRAKRSGHIAERPLFLETKLRSSPSAEQFSDPESRSGYHDMLSNLVSHIKGRIQAEMSDDEDIWN